MGELRIDLNADLGETEGDTALLEVVTSASIACGGHAGDRASMARVVELALAGGVALGSHPSYADRAGFGRVELGLRPDEVAAAVVEQVGALAEVADGLAASLSYMKPHGALYHRLSHDRPCAEAVLDALSAAGLGPLGILGQAGGTLLEVAEDRGWRPFREGYCDRAYEPDGNLVDRREPGALLTIPAEAARQAVSIALSAEVRSGSRQPAGLRPDSLCVHGDTRGALGLARAVRAALEDAGVVVAPFAPA